MQTWNAGGTAGLLQYIREKADDIEKAVIPQHLSIVFHPSGEQVEAGLVFHLVSGEVLIVKEKQDAEAVLNDGILNRMKIKIELLR
jgi:hypothetical protein